MNPLTFEYRKAIGSLSVTLVDCPDYLPYSEIANQLYSERPKTAESTDILVVRLPVDRNVKNVAVEVSELATFSDRLPKASVHLLYSCNFDIKLSENINPRRSDELGASEERARFLEWLQEAELRYYVDMSDAVLRARPGAIYRAPSGRYVSNFLRVGNVQVGRRPMDAIFFWMLPNLVHCGAILTETWSISSIALNASRLLQRYAPETHQICRVDMLSSYHDGRDDVEEQIGDSLRRVSSSKRTILVLISAIMTGRSFRRLQSSLARVPGIGEPAFLAIYKLTDNVGIGSLCNLFGYEGALDFQPKSSAPQGLTVVEIDRRTYFPLHVKEKTIRVGRKLASINREFFEYYKGTGSISVHRDARDLNNQEYRHNGIYLDASAMLRTRIFRKKLKAQLSSLPKAPTLIVTPPHEAGLELAKFAADFFRKTAKVEVSTIIHNDLSPTEVDTPSQQLRSCRQDDLILIVDDVSVTGRRLSRYQENLRKVECSARLAYLVGVARPESTESWRIRQRDLEYRDGLPPENQHIVRHVEKIILPDWNRRTCPWCREARFLSELFVFGEGNPRIGERLDVLENAKDGRGLFDDAIWTIPLPRDPALALTSNSIFFRHRNETHSDIIVAAAAALQVARDVGLNGAKLSMEYPLITLIHRNDYLGETFNDIVLKLAILRAARPSELEYWHDADEISRRELLSDLIVRPNGLASALEFLVSIIDGKILPPTLNDNARDVLRGHPAGQVLLDVMGKLETD